MFWLKTLKSVRKWFNIYIFVLPEASLPSTLLAYQVRFLRLDAGRGTTRDSLGSSRTSSFVVIIKFLKGQSCPLLTCLHLLHLYAALDELLFGEMVLKFTDGKLFEVSITKKSKSILIKTEYWKDLEGY